MGGTVITRKGMQLLVKLLATKSVLKFTRVSVGIGTLPDGYDPASLIDLVKYQMDGMISECKADGDVAKITMQISSIGIDTGFTMTEMGVFAEDPDIGEILYAYLNMKEDPQYIYAEGGEAQKFVEVTLDVAIEASTKVTTYINPQSMITRETFDREIGVLNGEIVSLKYPKFDDSGEVEGITNFNTFMDVLKSKISIFDFLRNLKAGLKFVLHTGQLVNNCVTDNPSLPLAAAQGKVLQDQLTKLNSDLTSFYSYRMGSTPDTWKSDMEDLYKTIPIHSIFVVYISAGYIVAGFGVKGDNNNGAIEFLSYTTIQTYKLEIYRGVYKWLEK